MKSSDVSVVVCAYTHRRWNDICAAITSVVKQDELPAELIVVTDHNDELGDDLRDFVRRVQPTTPVRVIANSGPRGLSGARNTGVVAAEAAVVAFLDDDAVADPGWLGHMVARYDNPAVRGVGGGARPRWPGGARPAWFPAEFDWVVGCSYPGQPEQAGPVRNFIGANMSLRRDDILAAGGFHTGLGRVGRIPLGCEETELCIAIAQLYAGTRMIYDPQMSVSHRVTDDRIEPRYFFRRCHAEGISKAAVSGLVGSADGLSSERTYTARVLPRGLVYRMWGLIRGPGAVADVIVGARGRRDLGAQFAMIVSGALVTVFGYARGRVVGAAIPPRSQSLTDDGADGETSGRGASRLAN
ncbi:glycosyltransferase family 2 protein [Gordonia sp. CPCC 206044]|uniref:glycosyltransferase family 2 protein n=1 Tax=Gordonia sp. CPCC 206044 TaxID=3140793 RepID=UPI003AF3D2F3